MNPLTYWNEDLPQRLLRLVRRSRACRSEDQVKVVQRIPLVNVSQDVRGYVIKAELPQVKKEDVRIALEDGALIITGERKFAQNSKKDHARALVCGRFAHSFVIPNDARPTRVTAVFKNGLLTVHLTRNAKGRFRAAQGQSFPARPCRSQYRSVPVTFSGRDL